MKLANHSNFNAIDHLSRALPKFDSVKAKDNTKIVGLFYYLWHGYHGTQGPYDITKILQQDSNAMDNLDSSAWPDPTNVPLLHGGEPMFGYYLADDEWVLRRHVQMFIDAQIDVLYFDVTNGFNYEQNYLRLFEVLTELQKQGFQVPKVCFYLAPQTRGCGTGNLESLWFNLYKPERYKNLWFYWKGKPLIICHSKRQLPDEVRAFFTWRAPTWGDPKTPECWAWEGNPPKMATDLDGNPEQMAISVCANKCDLDSEDPMYGDNMSDGHWGALVHGRSWHNGAKDERENATHYGFHIGEQMEFALKEDPPVVFVCQWNEWLVPFLTTQTTGAPRYNYRGHDICFRDEFNEEYSRDIEPMKGGYKDAYYMQLISFVRRFKGMEAPIVDTVLSTIKNIDRFTEWDTAGIAYRKYIGGCKPRDHRAYDAIGKYTNYTGRNEFHISKVASDDQYIYFYAECVNKITAANGDNWMNLYIRNPKLTGPSWEGYHFIINRSRSSKLTAVERCAKNGEYSWDGIGEVEYSVQNNKINVKIPKMLLGISSEDFSIEFKWSDNMQDRDVMDFYVNGDCAPMGRLNYTYYFKKSAEA